jgi:hypothetical protein
MKKLFLLVLFPFLMSFQCEDDFENSGFETSYKIQNNSNMDLFYIDEYNQISQIAKQSSSIIGFTLNNETIPVMPTASLRFEAIKLYSLVNEDYILRYQQTPVDDNLWVLTEPFENAFEYTLIITDQLLD